MGLLLIADRPISMLNSVHATTNSYAHMPWFPPHGASKHANDETLDLLFCIPSTIVLLGALSYIANIDTAFRRSALDAPCPQSSANAVPLYLAFMARCKLANDTGATPCFK